MTIKLTQIAIVQRLNQLLDTLRLPEESIAWASAFTPKDGDYRPRSALVKQVDTSALCGIAICEVAGPRISEFKVRQRARVDAVVKKVRPRLVLPNEARPKVP